MPTKVHQLYCTHDPNNPTKRTVALARHTRCTNPRAIWKVSDTKNILVSGWYCVFLGYLLRTCITGTFEEETHLSAVLDRVLFRVTLLSTKFNRRLRTWYISRVSCGWC